MAGQGFAPKAPEQRRNKTEPKRGEWVDLAPLETPVLPELPKGEWSEETRFAWESWRQDPVTSQYTISDISYALDTIRLHDAMTSTSANEVRLRMDSLGLTPKGKRDLRWRISEASVEEPKRQSPRRASKRRAHLTAVK